MNSYPTYSHRQFAPNADETQNMDLSADGMDIDMNNINMDMNPDLTSAFGMADGQALENYLAQAHVDKSNRRRSMPVYGAGASMPLPSPDSRRLSMLDYGNTSGGNLDAFQYNPQQGASMTSMDPMHNLAINTQFANQHSQFANMQQPGSAYATPLHPHHPNSASLGMTSPYANNMSMPMNINDPNLAVTDDDMNMFAQGQFPAPMVGSPIMTQDFMMNNIPAPLPGVSSAGMPPMELYGNPLFSATPDLVPPAPSRTNSQEQSSSMSRPHSDLPTPNSLQAQLPAQLPGFSAAQGPIVPIVQDGRAPESPFTPPPGGWPNTLHGNPHVNTQFKDAYARPSQGFNMLTVMMRVASRPNPMVPLGPVDMSCAFVVCDVEKHDLPIIYCSESFVALTGYPQHKILNRNCRFLQSPQGYLGKGQDRSNIVDPNMVGHIKHCIETRTEGQVSIINYKNGGQPFMNMLTVIPITMEDGGPVKYFVGLQVDLNETPNAIIDRNPSGTYKVNYGRSIALPNYRFNPDVQRPQTDIGQTIPKDEVAALLSTYSSTVDTEIPKRIWDKILLENADDVIHVLSLKGLFLYLSPSTIRVLEYEPSELIGTSLSKVCHPSDIVPVTRELKETALGQPVNVVYRAMRKNSGYVWFEGHGSLHTEQGKGRKCIILVGRTRPVYILSKRSLQASGGIGDNELWSKMSTSGMFLFVSGNVRQLLDKQPDDLIGTSIQGLMRVESKQEFGRVLELARTGKKAKVKHEMINKRGQVLQALTTIYPGDAAQGQKPSFVVAQTRLLKYSRASHGHRPSMYSKEHHSGESRGSVASVHSDSSAQAGNVNTAGSTPGTLASEGQFRMNETYAAGYGGQSGIQMGAQVVEDEDNGNGNENEDGNLFEELSTTKGTSWQYELRQMERRNRYLAEEVQSLLAAKKKRKRRKGAGQLQKDCANCHTSTTPEWRRGPSGQRDLCNSCGLRYAKQIGRVSPRNSQHSSDRGKKNLSPRHSQPIQPNLGADNAGPPFAPVPLGPGEKRTPSAANTESHAAKIARMEAMAPQGYSGGIPEKIEEDSEPE